MKENSIDESLIIKEIRDSNYVVTKLILEYFQAKRSSEFKYLLLDGHLLSFKDKVSKEVIDIYEYIMV